MMKVIRIKNLTEGQREKILKIWNAEYPSNLKFSGLDDLNQYLEKLEDLVHYCVNGDKKELIAWLATFNRQEERWIVMLVDPTQQKKGLGTFLLNNAKQDVAELNGWVIDHNKDRKENGDLYSSPLNFYVRNGFEVLKDIRFENGKLSAVKIKWIKN